MSERALDQQGRWRSLTVSFRCSPEEAAELDDLVALSGLTKQDYIMRRLACREVTVVPSSRVQKALADRMERVYRELRRICDASEADPELRSLVLDLGETFCALGMEPGEADTHIESRAIEEMGRL